LKPELTVAINYDYICKEFWNLHKDKNA
jgi:hypothetical protein